jgi:AcrR family transcriptional regulator
MAATRTPRSRWIDEGLKALAGGGPEAVRIELLAKELGVTKGGFYWHFDGRRALLDEMLDTWERVVIDEVIERVEGVDGDARQKVRVLFMLATEYSSGGLVSIELSVREWARRDKGVAARLKRVDNRRMDYMRGLYGAFCPDEAEVELRCMLAMSIFVANHFVAADHAPRTRTEVMELILERLLA